MDSEKEKRVIEKGSNREYDILGNWVIPEWKMEIIAKGMTESDLTPEQISIIEAKYRHDLKKIDDDFNKAFGLSGDSFAKEQANREDLDELNADIERLEREIKADKEKTYTAEEAIEKLKKDLGL